MIDMIKESVVMPSHLLEKDNKLLTEKTLWQHLLVLILMPMMLYGVSVTITEIILMNSDRP